MRYRIVILIALVMSLGAVSARADVFREKRGVDSRTINSRINKRMDNSMEGRMESVPQPAPARARVTGMQYDYTAAGVGSSTTYRPVDSRYNGTTTGRSVSGRSGAGSAGGSMGGSSTRDYRYGRSSEVRETGVSGGAGFSTLRLHSADRHSSVTGNPDDDAAEIDGELPAQQRLRGGANGSAPDPAAPLTDALPVLSLMALALAAWKLIRWL